VCQEIGLCTNEAVESVAQQVAEVMQEAPSPLESVGDRPYCTMCEYAVGEVDKMIENKKNEAEIKDALDRICYMLTAPIKSECVDFVNRYTDRIIDLFVSEYTPQEICAEIGLCNPTLATVGGGTNDLNQLATNELPPIEDDFVIGGTAPHQDEDEDEANDQQVRQGDRQTL
jgi:hypothetical protein